MMKVQMNPLANFQKAVGQKKETPRPGFEELLRQEIKAVDEAQKTANQKVLGLVSGKDPDLAGTSLALTKAELSLRLLLQVRNKVLEAYQEIMRMQL